MSYDGRGRRIVENPGTARDLYYSNQWQVLEERVGGAAKVHYVWSAVYVDALVLRDRDATGGGTLSERLWVQQDANWNVTALANGSGSVVERYVYDPYGNVTVTSPSWSVLSGSAYAWIYGHQGGRLDTTTGLYGFRNRDLSPVLARWIEVDPLRFAAGDTNLYRNIGNGPVNTTDPTGMVAPLPPDGWSLTLRGKGKPGGVGAAGAGTAKPGGAGAASAGTANPGGVGAAGAGTAKPGGAGAKGAGIGKPAGSDPFGGWRRPFDPDWFYFMYASGMADGNPPTIIIEPP
jgi:RHS repeat-associated protein